MKGCKEYFWSNGEKPTIFIDFGGFTIYVRCVAAIPLYQSIFWRINTKWVDQVDQTTKNDLNNEQTSLIYPTHPSYRVIFQYSTKWIKHSCWEHTCRYRRPFSETRARIDSHDAHGIEKSGAHLIIVFISGISYWIRGQSGTFGNLILVGIGLKNDLCCLANAAMDLQITQTLTYYMEYYIILCKNYTTAGPKQWVDSRHFLRNRVKRMRNPQEHLTNSILPGENAKWDQPPQRETRREIL